MYRFLQSFIVRLLLGAFLVFGVTVSSYAQLDNDRQIRLYIGGGISFAEADFDDDTGCRMFECDRQLGFSLFAGIQPIDYFAIELGYASVDEVVKLDNIFALGIDVTTLYLAAIGRLPINEQFALTGRIGMHSWEVPSKSECRSVINGEECTEIIEHDGTDPLYGLGVDFSFTENLRAQMTYTFYQMNRDASDITLDSLSGNLVFVF